MEQNQYMVDRIKSITSNHGIEPDEQSRLNAMLYRIVTSKGVISYDINDIEHLFHAYTEISIKEFCQNDEQLADFLSRVIEIIMCEANDLITGSIHVHFFSNQDNINANIDIIGKMEINKVDLNVGIWYNDSNILKVLLMIGKNITTYESDLHR